ncbi:MAG: hypothetical protein U1E78_01840 [Gammaproteobacteria bacterium]
MLTTYEKHKQNANSLLPYDILLIGQIEDALNVLKKCSFVSFLERPGKIYLKLDQKAESPNPSPYIKLSSQAICQGALDTVCDYYGVRRNTGYRVASLPGHFEILSPLLKYFGPQQPKETVRQRIYP